MIVEQYQRGISSHVIKVLLVVWKVFLIELLLLWQINELLIDLVKGCEEQVVSTIE